MGKLVVSTNTSLDGVVQDPDGAENFRLGGWFARYGGEDLNPWREHMFEKTLKIKALVLGRRTDEWFGSRWSSRTDEWAEALNALPKYVVSATLDKPRWTNATVLHGDAIKEVSKLKEETDGTLVIYASYQLARTLLEENLVDEVQLYVFPVVLGAGERLFGETSDAKPLRLIDATTIGNGLVHVSYEVVRSP